MPPVTASKGLSDMIVLHHKRKTALVEKLEETLRRHNHLALGKDKLVLRSISDRIEETAICGVLGISRDEMQAHKLFTVAKLEAAVGKRVVTENGIEIDVSAAHVATVKRSVSDVCSCSVNRGRRHIRDLGDLEAHEDPKAYLPTVSAAIDHVFARDTAKVNDARSVVRAYLRILAHHFPVAAADIECDLADGSENGAVGGSGGAGGAAGGAGAAADP